MAVGLSTLENVWLRTAKSLDETFEGVFSRFFIEVVNPEIKNPWSYGHREQNELEDSKEYERKNSILLEVLYMKMLDFLADNYRSTLVALEEHELVLVILISGMARIPLMPQTRELLNETLKLDENFSFYLGLRTLLDVQCHNEFSTYLARKQGIRLCEITDLSRTGEDYYEERSVGSSEECYENYCRFVKHLQNDEMNESQFVEEYGWFQDLQIKIKSGVFPKRFAQVSRCINIEPQVPFVTDNQRCQHFRLSGMLSRNDEEETVLMSWLDILNYPGIEELGVEHRMLQYNNSEMFIEQYKRMKARVLRSIWLSDWYIFLRRKRRSQKEYYTLVKKEAYRKEKPSRISDCVGAIPLQMRYDRFVESEARRIILRSMHRLSEATKRMRSRRFCENFSAQAFAIAQKECPGCLMEDSSIVDTELWKQGNIYEHLAISTGNLQMHRYFLYQGIEEKYGGRIERDAEKQQLKETFETQLHMDVQKIVKYWFMRNIKITRRILNEY